MAARCLENRGRFTETFEHDSLGRLDEVRLNGTLTHSMGYDGKGNLSNRTGVGSYAYTGPRPHAVTQAGGKAFGYDASGNMTSRAGSSVSWTSHDLPSLISVPGGSDSFVYGPGRERIGHTSTRVQTSTRTTVLVGKVYERVSDSASGITEHRHLIYAGGRVVAQYTRRSSGTHDLYYLHSDHQGSLDAVTNDSGDLVARLSFDAWGGRRQPGTWSGAPTSAEVDALLAITDRGYTGHAMLDTSATIHMNGRVYDPGLGRFLSADPFVPELYDGQAHNRYSYVLNNPLSLVDPSGFDPEAPSVDLGTIEVTGVREQWAGYFTASERVALLRASSRSKLAQWLEAMREKSRRERLRAAQTRPVSSVEAVSADGATGGKLDYNGQTVRNPHVRGELGKLRAGLDAEGYSNVDLTVTGGESYYDAATGRSISLTDGSVIPNRGSDSAHHVSNGARDVDLRRVGIPDADFRSAVTTYTNFNRMTNKYPDGHWHLGLPRTDSCPPGVCTP